MSASGNCCKSETRDYIQLNVLFVQHRDSHRRDDVVSIVKVETIQAFELDKKGTLKRRQTSLPLALRQKLFLYSHQRVSHRRIINKQSVIFSRLNCLRKLICGMEVPHVHTNVAIIPHVYV